MAWFARRRYEALALLVSLLTAVVHLATATPRVGGEARSIDLLERVVQSLDGRIADLFFRVRGPRAPHPDVVVVAVDEKSAQTWGLWPWSRTYMAQAFERLADAEVKAVGMDITYADPKDEGEAEARRTLERLATLPGSPEVEAWRASLAAAVGQTSDAALETAMRRLGPKLVQGVIPIDDGSRADFTTAQIDLFSQAIGPALVRGVRSGQGVERQFNLEKTGLFAFSTAQVPLPRFMATGSRFGHFSAILDLDGTIRRSATWTRLRDANGLLPSMALQTAAVALDAELRPVLEDGRVVATDLVGPSPRRVPIDELAPFTLIDYVGPAKSFPTVSIVDVVNGTVGKQALAGKVVLVGVTIVGSSGDQRVTPFKELEPGVFTHASLISNILENRFLVRHGWAVFLEAALAAVLSLILARAIPRVRFAVKAGLIVAVTLAWVGGAYAAFLSGTQIAVAAPVAGLLTASFGIVFLGYLSVDREKLKMKSTFSRYLGEDVIEIALENPDRLNRGEKREMTVLFSDIRGFTTLSERMSPEVLATFINEYLSPMTAIVFEEKGTLDKYIGDALMAFWNAPLDQPDHALRACRAAVKMLETLDRLKQVWREKGYPELEIGIGINSGPMVVGNMGSDVRVDYTVLGDAVNLGSRLEGTNKDYAERADMRSRWLLLHVLRRERTRAAPHIPNVFGGRTTLRFPRPEACMATGAASWRSQGERT